MQGVTGSVLFLKHHSVSKVSLSLLDVSARSTQMYYAKMTIDKSALEYITGRLNFSVSDDNLNIEDVKITTGKTEIDSEV